MRALVFLAVLAVAGAVLAWQAPELLPTSINSALESIGLTKLGPAVQSLVASAGSGESVMPPWAAALSGLMLAGAVGLALYLRRAPIAPRSEPHWLEIARTLAAKTANAKSYLRQCDAIGARLVPDVEQRGRAALARAHQLDLYWRFVGRNRTSKDGRAEGLHYQRWLATTRIALKAVAVMPEGRFMPTFHELKPALGVVGGEASEGLKAFYKRLGENFADYDAAWTQAYGELGRATVNRDAVLTAMERLRRINRAIAEDAARLVGPIEVEVRAVN